MMGVAGVIRLHLKKNLLRKNLNIQMANMSCMMNLVFDYGNNDDFSKYLPTFHL